MAGTQKGRERVTAAVVERAERNDEAIEPSRELEVRRSALDQFLLDQGAEAASRGLAGTGVKPEQFLRAVATVVASSSLKVSPKPEIAGQQYRSVLVAAMNVATLGLAPAPHVGHVWFVPFWDSRLSAQKIQLIVGYQGFVTLAGRAGWSMKVEPLWKGQVRRVNLANADDTVIEPLRRVPEPTERPEEMAFIARSPGLMLSHLTVRPYEWYLRARERSESYQRDVKNQREGKKTRPGPWITDELAMVAKTAIRWERKFVPMDPTHNLAAARLAYAFVADGAVGGAGELPSTDPNEASLWVPDRYDDDVPGEAAPRVTDAPDAALLEEIRSYEAGANCAGRDISYDVDALIASHGMSPDIVVPILAGTADGAVPPREVLIGVVELCRRAAADGE